MPETTLWSLIALAFSTGVIHTLAGPDHYIPFIAMAKAGKWSTLKTSVVTVLCGFGHVMSSVVLGLIGVAIGIALARLEAFESFRGDIAGWLLLGFGIAYMAWGIHFAIRNKPHTHCHVHEDGVSHEHEHSHVEEHSHVHASDTNTRKLTPWILFTVFIFGPCEVLIPEIMYPAAKGSWIGVIAVATVFGVATIGTMTTIVLAGCWGLKRVPSFERYAHLAAGTAVAMCGLAIKVGL